MVYGVTEFVVNAVPVITNAITEPGWHTMYGTGTKSSSGIEVTESSAMGYAPFWRAVNLIAADVAGMPCDIFKRQKDGGKKYAADHPAATLLRDRPARWWSARTMIETATYHANVYGNAYLPIVRDMSGAPMEIGLADPCGMIIKIMDDGTKWYCWWQGSKPVRVQDRDMIHLMGMSRDGIMGLCQLDLFRNALGVGMAAQEFGGRLFSQGANMSGLLMVPGSFSEEKIRNTMAAWNSMQTGLNNAHKVALLQDGVKFQPMSIDPDKAQFLGTREFEVRQTVSNITGVPPHMLGDSTRTSHNSLESESQAYLSRCLNPWLKRWEAELRAKLMTDKERMKDSHVIEFNRESEVQMEFDTKIRAMATQIYNSILTPNEARRLLNLPSAGPYGDRFYRQANLVVVGEDNKDDPAEVEPMADPSDPEEVPMDDLEDSMTDKSKSLLRAMVTCSVTSAIKLESAKMIQRAAMQADKFPAAVSEFYQTWTENTVPGLSDSACRVAVISHAETSKKLLMDVHSVSTSGSLKANVADVVATWDSRAEKLISSLMKAVE
jgi:HK97 family phage portal protein